MRKAFPLLLATGLAALSVTSAVAGPKYKNTPGHMMQRHGSVPGHPGASGYAPGHVKKMTRSRYNARAYAPEYRTYRLR